MVLKDGFLLYIDSRRSVPDLGQISKVLVGNKEEKSDRHLPVLYLIAIHFFLLVGESYNNPLKNCCDF
eukprot:SAG11_NODE_63_length_18904_cov_11.842914_9_plen_68_part_00